MSLKQAAIEYAERGWAVHPLEPRSKEPATKRGFKDATKNTGTISRLWGDYPDCNVSIATGAVSDNLMVVDLDIDPDKGVDGVDYLANWEMEHGKLPETACVITGRGGSHLYYRDVRGGMRCSVNNHIGVDVRCNGGYVMAPPSVHPNGNTVEWDLSPDDAPIADADDLVYAFIADVSKGSVDDTAFEAKERVGKGERDNHMYRFCCSQRSRSVPKEVCLAAAMAYNQSCFDPPMSSMEVRKKVNSAYRNPEGLSDEAKAMQKRGGSKAEASTGKTADVNGVVLAMRKNVPLQTVENHMRVLYGDERLSGRFKYNEVTYARDVILPLPWDGGEGARPITDVDYINFSAYCEKRYGLMAKAKATDAIMSVAEAQRYNPLREWLESLEWDGTDRLSTVFAAFLGAELTEYNSAVAHLLFRGGVARAIDPGCKFDYMPVLVGTQGQGKSYFVSCMAMRPEWYLDNLGTFQGDAAVEKIRGVWVAEVAELAAIKGRAEVEAVKAFITTRYDTIRPKYARETEQRPRTCVLVGTTNEHGFLTDMTGNRRFLPVQTAINEPVLDLFDEQATNEYMAQCWAQAFQEHTTGKEKLVMPKELEAQTRAAQEAHAEEDPMVGIIQAFLDDIADDARNIDKRVCMAQIAEGALGIKRDDYVKNRSVINTISKVMANKVSGWVPCGRHYLGGDWGRQRAWCPEGWTNVSGIFGGFESRD